MLESARLVERVSIRALLATMNSNIAQAHIGTPPLDTQEERPADAAPTEALRHRESHDPTDRSIALVNVQSRTADKTSDSSVKLRDECAMCGRHLR